MDSLSVEALLVLLDPHWQEIICEQCDCDLAGASVLIFLSLVFGKNQGKPPPEEFLSLKEQGNPKHQGKEDQACGCSFRQNRQHRLGCLTVLHFVGQAKGGQLQNCQNFQNR